MELSEIIKRINALVDEVQPLQEADEDDENLMDAFVSLDQASISLTLYMKAHS